MVIDVVGSNVVDSTHVCFIQAGTGPIWITVTRHPERLLINVQKEHYEILFLLGSRLGDVRTLNAIRDELWPHNIRGDWFRPTREVMAVVKGKDAMAAKRGRKERRTLTRDQVLEIFRLTHTTSLNHADIADRYGVTKLTVGNIYRGAVYRLGKVKGEALFKIEPAPPLESTPPAWRPLEYLVSEIPPGSPQYRVCRGKRGSK